MSNDINNNKGIPTDTDASCETAASQEELYLEETEEEVRAILISADQSPSPTTAEYHRSKIEELELAWEVKRSAAAADDIPHKTGSLDEQLDHAAEELITGDCDDPPLSKETIFEMLRMGWNVRRLGP